MESLFADVLCLVVQVLPFEDAPSVGALVRCMQTNRRVADALCSDTHVSQIVSRRLGYQRALTWPTLMSRLRESRSRCNECGTMTHMHVCSSSSHPGACVRMCLGCIHTSPYRRLVTHKDALSYLRQATAPWRCTKLEARLASQTTVARRGAPCFYHSTRYYWHHQVDALAAALRATL